MISKILGPLVQEKELQWLTPNDQVSQTEIATPFFENKKIRYRLAFDESPDLTIDAADAALESFFTFNPLLKEEVAQRAFENWEEFNQAVGYLDGIETYGTVKNRPKWMEDAFQNCLQLAKLTNAKEVWAYICPTEIVLLKDRYKEKKGVYINILCECDWEEEHGLQIVLKDGNHLVRVSGQDGNLFDYE